MFCLKCGQELPDGAIFCMKCGTNLQELLGGGMAQLPHPQQVQFVPAKCTNCGGVLDIDPSLETALCPFCQSAFVVSKAIQNYSISINSGTINIANANIQTGPSVENLLERAKQFESRCDFDSAKDYYEKALDIDPRNQEANKGIERLSQDYVFLTCRVVPEQPDYRGSFFFTVLYKYFRMERMNPAGEISFRDYYFKDIRKIGKYSKDGKITGFYLEMTNGEEHYFAIVPDTKKAHLENEIEQIRDIFYARRTFQYVPMNDDQRIIEGESIVRKHLQTAKVSLFGSKRDVVVDAAYLYMKHVRTTFLVAFIEAEKIADSIRYI